MKILITGANGQLGRELANQLGNNDEFELFLTYVSDLDITNINSIKEFFSLNQPDIIINCAAHTAVDLCEEEIERAYLINAKGPKNLAIVSQEFNNKMVQISTDYVFDGTKNSPYIETDQTNPQTIYGKSKLAGEKEVLIHNPSSFVLRTAWLYGDGKNFVNTMLNLSQKMNVLKVVNDQFGSPTSTIELTKAIIKLLPTELYGVYHATCQGSCSWYDFAKRIFELKKININVIPCTSKEFPQKAQRPAYSVLENRKFKDNLNYYFPEWDNALIQYLKEN